MVFVDQQPELAVDVSSIDQATLLRNVVTLAKGAKILRMPIMLTVSRSLRFVGDIWDELRALFPGEIPIARTSVNPWEDQKFCEAIDATDRPRLVMAGLWTEGALSCAALGALERGYDVYVAANASGAATVEDHERVLTRLSQAGVVPVTVRQVLPECHGDWDNDAALTSLISGSGEADTKLK